jgi:hypothetical protein
MRIGVGRIQNVNRVRKNLQERFSPLCKTASGHREMANQYKIVKRTPKRTPNGLKTIRSDKTDFA